MSNIIQMTFNTVSEIFQTQIDDKWATKLCMWLCEMWMAWSIRKLADKTLPPWTLEQLNRLNDDCIKRGGLKRLTDGDSDNGFVANHEINAECAGLKGYTKIYEDYDTSKCVNLLQWGAIIELRGKTHSMCATGWYVEDGKTYFNMFDPWKGTNDKRFDCETRMTQHKINNAWVDSREIFRFAWYHKNGTNWI